MERLTYFEGGKWWIRVGDTEHSGPWVDRLAAYEDKIPFVRLDEAAALVKAQDEGLIQPMICTGCRYDRTESLAEHEAHCMRCIRNRYLEDHYTRAEAEAALGGGGDG